MAKRSMIEREKKRSRVRAKYMQKRMALKAIIADRNVSDEERWEAQLKLQALPRNSCASTAALRCNWPSARGISKIWIGSKQTSRSSYAWRCSGSS